MATGAGSGKTWGEKNVHVERWQAQVEKQSTDDLVELYHRLPPTPGRFTARQMVVRRELENRGLSLRDLGIDDKPKETHRTTTSIAPERQPGRRLTERYMYRGHCLCGWIGETHPTWALAKEDAALHRRAAGRT